MKFLHTSDLHIGLRLCEQPMNDEIAYLLDEIAEIAVREGCQAVVIAGDIYDRSNPAPDSVKLFDGFVSNLVKKGLSVIGISGNHDSAERIGCFSEILQSAGVYFSPAFNGSTMTATLTDEFGEVNFILLPFVRPSVCSAYSGEDISTYTEAVRYQLSLAGSDKTKRNVVVAHGYTGKNAENADDEEAGGTGFILPDVFDGYDYTALGHLHTAHKSGESAWYSGSPVRCSFAETESEKVVNIVTLGEKGSALVEKVPLHPMHETRELRGTYDELISLETRRTVGEGDYIKAVLTDEDDIPDAVMKLRIVYPNLLLLSYDNKRTRVGEDVISERLTDSLKPEEVFAELYEMQNGNAPTDEIMKTVRDMFSEVGET